MFGVYGGSGDYDFSIKKELETIIKKEVEMLKEEIKTIFQQQIETMKEELKELIIEQLRVKDKNPKGLGKKNLRH